MGGEPEDGDDDHNVADHCDDDDEAEHEASADSLPEQNRGLVNTSNNILFF